MNETKAFNRIQASDGTQFTYRDGFTGMVEIQTPVGRLAISCEAVLELVAKGYVLPVRKRQLRRSGHPQRAAALDRVDARALVLGLVE